MRVQKFATDEENSGGTFHPAAELLHESGLLLEQLTCYLKAGYVYLWIRRCAPGHSILFLDYYVIGGISFAQKASYREAKDYEA